MANSATVGMLRILLTANTAEFDAAMKRASSAVGAWSKDLTSIGRQASAIGTSLTKTLTIPLLGLGAGAIKSASDFESSFAGIRKTVNDATDAMGNLTPVGAALAKGMRDLAKTIPINVNELNKIGEAAGQLGIKSENILGFTRVMADLGVTTNLSSDQAATSLARLANITQMPQSEFDRLGSTVVALGNNLATTESEIVDFGLRIAGAGEIAGLTEAQILAIGGAMSSVGVEAEAGGTAVQKVLLGITEAVATGNKQLGVFAATAGMSASEFAKAWKSDAAGAFTLFVEGLGKSGTDAFQILDQLDLKDQRLIRSFLSLANAGEVLRTSVDLGTKAWGKNNALTKEAEQRYKTFESQLTLFWNQIRDVGIELGTALLPTMRDLLTTIKPVISGISEAVKWFNALPEPVRLGALAVGGLVAAAGPALWLFGQMTTALGLVAGAFTAKGIAAKAAGTVMSLLGATTIPALVASLGGLAVAVAAVSVTVYALNQAWHLLSERQERAKGEQLEQARRYAMIEQASNIAGRAVLTYAEAVQIVTDHTRKNVDEQERAQTVYTQAAGPPAHLATVHRTQLAPALNETSEALKRLRDALSGKETFAEAARWMTVIGEIKDLSKLTTDEQQRALSVLQGAVDKYNALKQIAPPALLATVIQLDAMNAKLTDSISHVELLGLTFDKALDPPSIAASVRELERLGTIVPGFEKSKTTYTPIIPGSVIDTSGAQAGKSFGAAMMSSLGQTFKTQLGPTIMSAITGGGNIGNAIGGLLGGSITQSLTGFLTKAAPQFMSSFLGQAIGSFLPGLGALMGPLLGKLGGFFKGLFGGVSEEVKKARTELEGFQSTLHSGLTDQQKREAGNEKWKMDVIAVRDAYLATGRTAAEAEAIVRQMWDTDHPERSKAAIEKINAVLKEQAEIVAKNKEAANSLYDDIMAAGSEGIPSSMRPAIEQLLSLGLLTDEQAAKLRGLGDAGAVNIKKMEDASALFQGRLEALGPAFQQAKLDETSKKYINALDTLIRGGADVGGVLFDAREELSALASESIKTGRTLPANMKPWIEELHRAGLLVDENGDKIEDLGAIKYGEAIKTEAEIAREGWDRILAKIDELISKVTGPLTDAIDKATRDRTINVDVNYNDDPPTYQGPREGDNRGYVRGTKGVLGRWFGDFGSGQVATLHNREAVITPSQALPFAASVLAGAMGASGLMVPSHGDMLAQVAGSALSGSEITRVTNREQTVILAPILMSQDMNTDAVVDDVFRQLPAGLAINRYQIRTAFKKVIG